jgi:Tfp pilus assembly protein PilF
LCGLALAVDSINPAFADDSLPACSPAVGRLVSLQGNIEIQRRGAAWVPVRRLDTVMCGGDRLRADNLSRAMLFLQPETFLRVDQNTAISLTVDGEEIEVEFFAAELAAQLRTSQSRGAGYFITRFPKKFKIKTPHMNAAVEGTEFMVQVSGDATKLTVLEGEVTSQSVATSETQLVAAGQAVQSGAAGAGEIIAVVKPQDAVQWVLRYPPISDGSGSSRAEDLLRAGSVDDAMAEVDGVLRANPADSNALALRSVIQVAKNDRSGSLESAILATAADKDNHRAWIAKSYAQQASFDLDAALESAKKASLLDPGNSLAHARVAELQLSLGDVRRSEEAARAAITANPAESQSHAILGFVHLAQVDTDAARVDFQNAIERDSFSALPRLGLGLAKIRDGQLIAGREQIEIAVALDPSNALIRSYVGKAYYEENTPQRDDLAATQFQLASQVDTRDPTPHFYNAILKQSQNRPVDALVELDAAIGRNDNRAVYRSRLLVDDDAASQGATIASIYGELGFERLDVLESAKALMDNAANASAHRQLANAYANMPRHDIARVSEALQAQIRQPVSIAPVPTLLGTDSLLVLKDVGPSQLGTNEFNQLFNRNDFEVTAEAVGGSRDSVGGQLVMDGLDDRISYSASAMQYRTDGFIENDAAEKAVYDLFVHGQLRPGSSIQVDAKRSEVDIGQTFAAFAPMFAEPTTISEQSDSLRISGHESSSPRLDWIWSAVYEDRRRDVFSYPDGFLLTGNDAKTVAIEFQNVMQVGSWQVVSGGGYVEEDDDFISGVAVSMTAANAYAYGQWHSLDHGIGVQVGLAIDAFRLENSIFVQQIERDRVNPRIGLVWSPTSGTTIRAAAASTLKRPLVRGQTIEPTQIAGFNQYFTGFERFYGDPNGTVSERVGVAVDEVFSNSLRGGIEVSRRDLDVARLGDRVPWDEKSVVGYLYKSFSGDRWQSVVSLDAEYEEFDRPPIDTGSEGFLDLRTTRVPLGARFFSDRGWTVRTALTYVKQSGRFAEFIGDPIVIKDDDGVIADFAIEYELPRRRGRIATGVNNLFDEFVDVIEIDPLNPRIALRQLAYLRIRIDF